MRHSAGLVSTISPAAFHSARPSIDALNIERYCSSLARSASSATLRPVMSRASARMRSCPPMVTRLPNTSCQRSVPSLLLPCHSTRSCSPATARAMRPSAVFAACTARSPVPSVPTSSCAELLARIAERRARLGIDVDDGAGVDVVHENRVLGGVEDRAIAFLGHAQRLGGALALGDVLRSRVCVSATLAPSRRTRGSAGRARRCRCRSLRAARLPAASSSAARTSRAVRRVSRKWNTSHMASASAVTQPGPVQRLLQDLRASFGLVAA